MNIKDALSSGESVLNQSDSPEIDSQLLLMHALQCSQSYLFTWPDQALNNEQITVFEALLQQRAQGEPIAYLLGQRGFWTLDLKVTPDTLIPRPDTELLVQLAVDKLMTGMRVADLGTGSGAIALALATENDKVDIIATDQSWPALQVAKQNAADNRLDNVRFWQGSWLESIADDTFDMIVANPPYIEKNDPHLKQGDVLFEPLSALVSDQGGLADIIQIINQAKRCLKPSGWLFIEHGYQQGAQVKALFEQAGFNSVSLHQDYGDNDRIVMGQLGL